MAFPRSLVSRFHVDGKFLNRISELRMKLGHLRLNRYGETLLLSYPKKIYI
jgi:hypothetical protein